MIWPFRAQLFVSKRYFRSVELVTDNWVSWSKLCFNMAQVKKMKFIYEIFTFQSRQTEGYFIICIKVADVWSFVMQIALF
jgi:hypothetical protein